MLDIRLPIYQWGQRVAAIDDLLNDGSYPDFPEGALLVAAGTIGEIVRIGQHEDENVPVYLVEFPTTEGGPPLVVGVLEQEIRPV